MSTLSEPSFTTPEAAESAFYQALEAADLRAMMAVWESTEAVVCIHPLGPRLQGRVQVRRSWEQIFNSGARLSFSIKAVHSATDGDLAVHTVVEHITVLNSEEQPAQPVLATNVYRRGPQGWRLLLHHASPGQDQSSPPTRPLH